jgi:hypothetical protein
MPIMIAYDGRYGLIFSYFSINWREIAKSGTGWPATLMTIRRIVLGLTERGVQMVFVKENLTFTSEDSPMSNLLRSAMGGCSVRERADQRAPA